MLHTIDVALTQAATVVLFGSFAYFSIAFAVFVQKETVKPQTASVSVIPSEESDALDLPDCPFERGIQSAVVREVLDTMQQSEQSTPDPLEPIEDELNSLYASCDRSVESNGLRDDDAIAYSSVPSLNLLTDQGISVQVPQRQEGLLSAPRSYKGASLHSLAATTSIKAASGNSTDVTSTSMQAAENDSLPPIPRDALTIWSGRNQEKLVTVASISIPIPGSIKRRRWRSTDVISLDDLKTFATIV